MKPGAEESADRDSPHRDVAESSLRAVDPKRKTEGPFGRCQSPLERQDQRSDYLQPAEVYVLCMSDLCELCDFVYAHEYHGLDGCLA